MNVIDIPYLLQRASFHRHMERTAECSEARCAHHQFVKRYQQQLLSLRRMKRPSASRLLQTSFPMTAEQTMPDVLPRNVTDFEGAGSGSG